MQSKNNTPLDAAQAKQLLQTPEGRQLIELLNRNGAASLRQAAAALNRGDQVAAQQAVAPLLRDPQTAALLEKLTGKKE
jgi:hypothetical protein